MPKLRFECMRHLLEITGIRCLDVGYEQKEIFIFSYYNIITIVDQKEFNPQDLVS